MKVIVDFGGSNLLALSAQCSLDQNFLTLGKLPRDTRSPLGTAQEVKWHRNSPFMRLPCRRSVQAALGASKQKKI